MECHCKLTKKVWEFKPNNYFNLSIARWTVLHGKQHMNVRKCSTFYVFAQTLCFTHSVLLTINLKTRKTTTFNCMTFLGLCTVKIVLVDVLWAIFFSRLRLRLSVQLCFIVLLKNSRNTNFTSQIIECQDD